MERALVTDTLNNFVAQLQKSDQCRFNEGLRRDLIEVLQDGTVQTQVYELLNDQHQLERSLYDERQNLLRNLQGDPNLEDKLLQNDNRILDILDDLCQRQQAVLHGLKVPAFRVTKNSREIELQMMILEFIRHLPA